MMENIDLEAKHQKLKINAVHFTSFNKLLVQTFAEFHYDSSILKLIENKVESLRNKFVNTKLEIWDKLGGAETMEKFINCFYDKVLLHPLLKEYFQETDMKSQKKIQNMFLTMAFGGPKQKYQGNLKQVHWKLKLTDHHFNVFKDITMQVIRQFGADPPSLHEVSNLMEQYRKEIVSIVKPFYNRIGEDKAIYVLTRKFISKFQHND